MRGKGRRTVDLIESCSELLREIQPASVRAVCYQLFVAGKIDSMAKSNTQRVSRLLTTAREEGIIPWEWIVDETREVEQKNTWADPQRFARTITRAYRKDKWAAQPVRVEMWSEKGTVRGTLGPVLDEYEVAFRVMHGFASATAIHDAAETVRADQRKLVILYVGDWDPSGLNMSEKDVPSRLREYVKKTPGGKCSWKIERIALTQEDTEDLPLFAAETKIKDPRYQWFVEEYGEDCWELDAMSPTDLRDRVKDRIEDLLDRATWDRYVTAEALEQESITNAVKSWNMLKATV